MVQKRMDGWNDPEGWSKPNDPKFVFPISFVYITFFFFPPLPWATKKKIHQGLGVIFPVIAGGFCRDFKGHFPDG